MLLRPSAYACLVRQSRSRKKPLGAPGARALAAIDQPVMQPKRPIAPKFDFERHQPEPYPIIGPWHLRERIFGAVFGNLLLERPTPFHRSRLCRCPSADLAVLRAARKISVSLSSAHFAHAASHPHNPAKAFPMEIERSMRVGLELVSLCAFPISVKNEAVFIYIFE